MVRKIDLHWAWTIILNSTPWCEAVLHQLKKFYLTKNSFKNVKFRILKFHWNASMELFLTDSLSEVLLRRFSVFSCSGKSHAHVQCSRGHWHYGVRHSWPCTDFSKATTERSLVCHPQPASACKNGRRVQGLWEYVWSHAWHLSRNIRCVCVCEIHVIQSPLVDLIVKIAEVRKSDWITLWNT